MYNLGLNFHPSGKVVLSEEMTVTQADEILKIYRTYVEERLKGESLLEVIEMNYFSFTCKIRIPEKVSPSQAAYGIKKKLAGHIQKVFFPNQTVVIWKHEVTFNWEQDFPTK